MLSLFSVVPAVNGQPPAKKTDSSDTEDPEKESKSSDDEVEEKNPFVKPAPTANKPPAKAKVQLFFILFRLKYQYVPCAELGWIRFFRAPHCCKSFICLSHKPWTFPKS